MFHASRLHVVAWAVSAVVAVVLLSGCSTSREVDSFYFQMTGLRTMVAGIMKEGPMSGVSIALRVYPRCDDKTDTDVVRSAIYTMGDIDLIPFAEVTDVACQTVKGN